MVIDMPQPQPIDPELVADVEEAFLGYWPTELAAIFTQPYRPGVLLAYAYRDHATHIPKDGDER